MLRRRRCLRAGNDDHGARRQLTGRVDGHHPTGRLSGRHPPSDQNHQMAPLQLRPGNPDRLADQGTPIHQHAGRVDSRHLRRLQRLAPRTSGIGSNRAERGPIEDQCHDADEHRDGRTESHRGRELLSSGPLPARPSTRCGWSPWRATGHRPRRSAPNRLPLASLGSNPNSSRRQSRPSQLGSRGRGQLPPQLGRPGRDLAGVIRPVCRTLGRQRPDELSQLGRNRWRQVRKGSLTVGKGYLHHRPRERPGSAQALVGNDAERVQVRRDRSPRSASAFRREIPR